MIMVSVPWRYSHDILAFLLPFVHSLKAVLLGLSFEGADESTLFSVQQNMSRGLTRSQTKASKGWLGTGTGLASYLSLLFSFLVFVLVNRIPNIAHFPSTNMLYEGLSVPSLAR